MAYDNDQKEPSLPAGDDNYRRKTENHLPRYFRTNFNSKFLANKTILDKVESIIK